MGQEHVTVKNDEASHLTMQDQLMVRINGTLPDISALDSEEKSERGAEVKRQATNTNTSCSVFAKIETEQKMFHLLIGTGQGTVKSIEKGASELGLKSSSRILATTTGSNNKNIVYS